MLDSTGTAGLSLEKGREKTATCFHFYNKANYTVQENLHSQYKSVYNKPESQNTRELYQWKIRGLEDSKALNPIIKTITTNAIQL